MSDVNSVSKVSFKDTLNLPRTEFPIRARAGTDHIIIERWHTQQLSEKAALCNQGAPQFTLSDGPPYANGSLHLGHAYNKILKDIIGKFHRMSGKQVFLMPGWDCHGLPIEFAVTKEKKYDSRAAVIEACRAYAQKWIDIQKEELKQLGLILWWNKAWATMYPWYESSVIRAFKEFVTQGYIERKNKTVPWCPTCGTVLAAAEIEYKERANR
jgi:isoleucyl-tRNA synthetase